MFELIEQNKLDAFEEASMNLLQECVAEKLPVMLEAAIKRVNRVRDGKIQRNHRVAGDDNYTIRQGRLVRITPLERRRRQLSQRLAARKRRAKISIALRKRKVSLMRSKALGAS